MRLSSQQVASIKRAVHRHFGPTAEVRLFGSRVDDNARGRDVDLYISADLPDSDPAIAAEVALSSEPQASLGEQHIDPLIDYSRTHATPCHIRYRAQPGNSSPNVDRD